MNWKHMGFVAAVAMGLVHCRVDRLERDVDRDAGNTPGTGGAGGADAAPDGNGAANAGGDSGHDGQADLGDGATMADTGSDAALAPDVAPSNDLRGSVVDTFGRPRASVPILVNGTPYTAGADGKFTVPDAPATYELVAVHDGPPLYVLVFRGATTRAPVIRLPPTPSGTLTVSGVLSGGSGFPLPSNATAGVSLLVSGLPVAVHTVFEGQGPGFGPLLMPSGSTSIRVVALQWIRAADGSPSTYAGWGSTSLDASAIAADGGSLTANVTLSTAVSARSFTGSATVPTGLTLTTKTVSTEWIAVAQDLSTATSVSCKIPTGLAAENYFSANATDGVGGTAYASMIVPDSASSAELSLSPPATQVLPVSNATQVSYDTSFTFTAQPGTVRVLDFYDSDSSIRVHTTADSEHIPDLRSAGVAPKAASPYSWRVSEHPSTHSVDEFLAEFGPKPPGWSSHSVSGSRDFTTAP